MKTKKKMGKVEILGIIGIFIWVLVVFLRQFSIHNDFFVFLLGSLPNLGAGWGATMLAKVIIQNSIKKKYSFKIHLLVCAGIFVLAFISECIHDKFLNSAFDRMDMIVAFAAQAIICLLPIGKKDFRREADDPL